MATTFFKLIGVSALALGIFTGGALADDQVKKGKKLFKFKCGICHSTVKGKKKIGPSLFDIVGRKIRHHAEICIFKCHEKRRPYVERFKFGRISDQPEEKSARHQDEFSGFQKRAETNRCNCLSQDPEIDGEVGGEIVNLSPFHRRANAKAPIPPSSDKPAMRK